MILKPALLLTMSALPALCQYGYPVVYPAAKQGGQYMHNYYIPPAPSTTPWWPSWSPDGKWIAVAMQGSLWKVDPATGNATELLRGPDYYSSPEWSPDGKWIVYTADDHARSVNLGILNVETGETRALTSGGEVYLEPAFSPDGTRLAYVTTRGFGNFQIKIRPISSGRWAGDEISLTEEHRYPRDRLYFSAWDIATQPAWTPDGKEIVFVSNRDVPLGAGDLWRMPAKPNGMREGRVIHREQTLYRTRPQVSPDGKRIVYSSTAGAADQYNHLYVVPISGGAPYKLTFGESDNFNPRWSPDGEHIAYVSNAASGPGAGLPQLWILETYGGGKRKVAIRERQWKSPMGKLRLTVSDAATGKPLHARIHGMAADGKFYAPVETYSRIGRSAIDSFHTAGADTIELPPGKLTIEAVRGYDYEPASATAEIQAGKTSELRVRMKRLYNPAAKGWYSGSTHVHMNYAGNLRNTPDNLWRMAQAEGLDSVMDLVANKDNRILDWQYFGRDTDRIHFGEEYRPPFYGHVFFIGLKDHLISPFTTGYEGTGIESLYPSNTDMFRKARAQGAVTGYVHAFYGDPDPLTADLGVAKAFPVDAALGLVDCLEWSGSSRSSIRVWHHALNNDLKIAPSGGEDSITNLHRTKLIGSVRTYAYVGPGKFSTSAWIEALRAGRTFFSTGPLLELKINGKLPGESLKLDAPGTVTIEGSVDSIAPLQTIAIHRNGAILKKLAGPGKFRETFEVNESSWFSLYAEGPNYRLLDGEFVQAATNAVRVYVGDAPIRNKESAQYFVRWIDRLRSQAEAWPFWRSDQERSHVFAQFDEARRFYESR